MIGSRTRTNLAGAGWVLLVVAVFVIAIGFAVLAISAGLSTSGGPAPALETTP